MQLFAYNPIGRPDELLIWVGVLGVATPPAVAFEVFGEAIQPLAQAAPFEPLGDEVCDIYDRALNHRALFTLPWPATNERFTITVIAAGQRVALTSKRPPQSLPAKNASSFNLLLSSCYYQPNDKAQALTDIIKAIKPSPDFTVLAGDQVYLDLPSQQNLPDDRIRLAQVLGKKYQANWFSSDLKQPGLADVLAHGPVLCVPDDHEFWNNFPYFQVQLNNTHREKDRTNWREVATQLYERYQMSPAQSKGFFRQDIEPLCMLFLDGRTHRAADTMFNSATSLAIEQWKTDLLQRKKNRQPAVGLLSSGQALVIEKPGIWDRNIADMEMVNYEDFANIKSALQELFAAEIPVLYITGDVHWGRILEGKNQRGKVLFYEVIASPSRLIDTLGSDQKNQLINKFSSEKRTFPRHPEVPEDIPDLKLTNIDLAIKHRQVGDHVAMLRFNAIPGGLEFSVDYVCTDPVEKNRRDFSTTKGPYKLLGL
ncbi:MAG: alkaline phosphatase D family protein [Cellvibrio sp.]|uniref:alkaline phosphatase D family protein n=1 Tax=Cellvibrio sp. TaxID=1965322 RepID=UPI0031ACEA02